MYNKNQRIKLDINNNIDNHIKVNLNQEIDNLEILSLKINQVDFYQSFNSDYGVLVGRVTANGGVGIPNAKISIFIPVTDDDKIRSEIFSKYPFTTPRDKNRFNKRYNLLPRVGRKSDETGFIKPKQPFGSFPTKEEIITNDTWFEVYEKYYKYSTITNNSGDYMIFGVPVGNQTVHMSVDITDIGKYSMTPAEMVGNLGYSRNLFNNNLTTIKESNDLEDLPHIETQDITVDVIPFWGDKENFEIGITRQDFRIRAELVNTIRIFGSYFRMPDDITWGNTDPNGLNADSENGFHIISYDTDINDFDQSISANTYVYGDIKFEILYYPNNFTDENINKALTGDTNITSDQLIRLTEDEYFLIKERGSFILTIPCNRRKVITNEFGEEIIVDNNSPNGVFTEFFGNIHVMSDDEPIVADVGQKFSSQRKRSIGNARYKLRIPQGMEFGFDNKFPPQNPLSLFRPNTLLRNDITYFDELANVVDYSELWRKEAFKFTGGKYYSISQFYPTFALQMGGDSVSTVRNHLNRSRRRNTGALAVKDSGIPSNGKSEITINDSDSKDMWGGQWLNFTLYFFNFSYVFRHGNTTQSNRVVLDDRGVNAPFPNTVQGVAGRFFLSDNFQSVGSDLFNSKFYATPINFPMRFVEVPINDLFKINEHYLSTNLNYFRKLDLNLEGDYMYYYDTNYNPNNFSGSLNQSLKAFDQYPVIGVDNPYFSTGLKNQFNCIELLKKYGFI